MQGVVINVLKTAFSLIAGTYVEHKMIEFLKSPATNKTDIDALILFEQLVNLINAPVILLQMVRILVPLRLTNGYPVAVQGGQPFCDVMSKFTPGIT